MNSLKQEEIREFLVGLGQAVMLGGAIILWAALALSVVRGPQIDGLFQTTATWAALGCSLCFILNLSDCTSGIIHRAKERDGELVFFGLFNILVGGLLNAAAVGAAWTVVFVLTSM